MIPSVRSTVLVAAAAIACLAGYVFVYSAKLAEVPIRSDGFSYYVYLPSWFIYQDPTLAAVANDCCGGVYPEFTAIIRWPGTHRWVNAHPIGVAVMQIPFFAAADALTRWSNLSRDGFTVYYQHAAGLAGVFWTVVGLFMLRRLLLLYYSDGVTAATLAAILLGTNLYHYGTFDTSYSHPYSFFLIASFLFLMDRWHRGPSIRLSILVGIVSGLIVLTRHTNALALILFPLYGVSSADSLKAAIRTLGARRLEVLAIAAAGALVLLPQLAIYYQSTGRILVSSYGELGFTWGSPRLAGVLFGVSKGLFFWSPLLLLALAGLLLTRSGARAFRLGSCLFLAANVYVIASWGDWQFGASYGHRGFVDVLPIFALGLAAAFEWSARVPARRAAVTVGVTLAVTLSIVQMTHYWRGELPFSDTTWDQYRRIVLRLPPLPPLQ